jgi:hypothetical protein
MPCRGPGAQSFRIRDVGGLIGGLAACLASHCTSVSGLESCTLRPCSLRLWLPVAPAHCACCCLWRLLMPVLVSRPLCCCYYRRVEGFTQGSTAALSQTRDRTTAHHMRSGTIHAVTGLSRGGTRASLALACRRRVALAAQRAALPALRPTHRTHGAPPCDPLCGRGGTAPRRLTHVRTPASDTSL